MLKYITKEKQVSMSKLKKFLDRIGVKGHIFSYNYAEVQIGNQSWELVVYVRDSIIELRHFIGSSHYATTFKHL